MLTHDLINSVSTSDNVTIYFLKDILGRRKAYLHNDAVKVINVPQYKNLTLDHVMAFISNKPQIVDYLPDEPDLPKVPKQWIVNVCAAVLGDNARRLPPLPPPPSRSSLRSTTHPLSRSVMTYSRIFSSRILSSLSIVS